MYISWIIAFLKEVVNRFGANTVYLDRTSFGDLILDWPNGRTPDMHEILAQDGQPSPLRAVAAHCFSAAVLVSDPEGETVRLWLRDGQMEHTEKVKRRAGSRMTLQAALTEQDFARIAEACETLAVVHLGTRFELNDAVAGLSREICFASLSAYLQQKLRTELFPLKTVCGTAEDVRYEICFAASWKCEVAVHLHNGEQSDTGALREMLERLPEQNPARYSASAVVVTSGGTAEHAMEKVGPVLLEAALLYLKNRFAFGHDHLDYYITTDLLAQLYTGKSPYYFPVAAACSCARSRSGAYNPLLISGDETKTQFKKSIRNAFEIKYRETFPTHTLMHLTRENAWQLILGEVQCDCILFCEDLEDVVCGLTLDEQADLGSVLRQYVFDDKRILMFSKHSPQEIEGIASPLRALLSYGLPAELKP